LDRVVAIKFLKPTRHADQTALDRFLREARMAAALNHPHVCTIHEIGEHDDEYFLVMEFLEGETLDKRLASGPLRPEELFPYADQVTSALEAAHAKGIIHRDIKPANIFLTQHGGVKVLDFGLAKVASLADVATYTDSSASRSLTGHGILVGTPGFISPEQLRGEPADARSDIFSLGATLYQMATGKPAFGGTTAAVMVASVLHGEPVPAARANPALPPCCEAVLTKCLQKSPELRYQSVAELRRDLLQAERVFAAGKDAHSGVPAWMSRRSTIAVLASVVLAAAIAVGTLWFRAHPSSPANTNLQQRTLTSNAPDNPVYAAAISPDGKYLAYADVTGVFLRLLETGETHTIALPPGFCFR
jgi:serine/threonine protein kinase